MIWDVEREMMVLKELKVVRRAFEGLSKFVLCLGHEGIRDL